MTLHRTRLFGGEKLKWWWSLCNELYVLLFNAEGSTHALNLVLNFGSQSWTVVDLELFFQGATNLQAGEPPSPTPQPTKYIGITDYRVPECILPPNNLMWAALLHKPRFLKQVVWIYSGPFVQSTSLVVVFDVPLTPGFEKKNISLRYVWLKTFSFEKSALIQKGWFTTSFIVDNVAFTWWTKKYPLKVAGIPVPTLLQIGFPNSYIITVCGALGGEGRLSTSFGLALNFGRALQLLWTWSIWALK